MKAQEKSGEGPAKKNTDSEASKLNMNNLNLLCKS